MIIRIENDDDFGDFDDADNADDDNDDDNNDDKAHQVMGGEDHSTSIALHPKYSAKKYGKRIVIIIIITMIIMMKIMIVV